MRKFTEGLVMAAVSLVALWGAWQVPAAPPGDTWAGIVPFSAAVALMLLAAILLMGAASQSAAGPQDSGADTREHSAALEIVGLFLVALIYQQSFRWFGYLLPTALVAPVVLFMFGVRSRTGLALSAVLCPLAFHIIFFELLGVFPPYGEVFDLLDAIRG